MYQCLYKTKQVDEQGKPIYQDVCYPVTKDFREKLYNEIISEYEKAKDKSNEKARESAEKHHGNPDKREGQRGDALSIISNQSTGAVKAAPFTEWEETEWIWKQEKHLPMRRL